MKNKGILLNDALKIFYSEFPSLKVKTVIKYDQLFVFDSISLNESNTENSVRSLVSVDEVSGEIKGFNPLYCEYQKYLTALSEAISL
jgi:hypothetical protein